jgi:hypothetical protein
VAAPQLAQDRQGTGRLDALGHHPEPEALGEREDAPDQRDAASCRGVLQRHDEGPVDLQLADREPLQVGEAGVAGPEVVERQPDTQRGEGVQHGQGPHRVAHDGGLGDLEHQPVRPDARLSQRGAHPVRQGRVVEAAGGQVDGHDEVQAGGLPPGGLLQRGGQHEVGQPVDQAGGLGDRHEHRRRDRPEEWVVPAGERLHPGHPSCGEVELGLVGDGETVLVERPVEVAEQGEPLGPAAVHGPFVDRHQPPVGARRGQRGVGAPEQLGGVRADRAFRRGGHAHPGAHADDGVGQGDGLGRGGPQQLGQLHRPARTDRRDRDGEVLAGQPGDRGPGQLQPAQPTGDLVEHLVADRVAEGVVHLAEPVDQHDEDRRLRLDLAAGLARPGRRARRAEVELERGHEHVPGGQARQAVVRRLPAQPVDQLAVAQPDHQVAGQHPGQLHVVGPEAAGPSAQPVGDDHQAVPAEADQVHHQGLPGAERLPATAAARGRSWWRGPVPRCRAAAGPAAAGRRRGGAC